MHATFERLDDPHQRARAEHQLRGRRRRSYWGIVCFFVHTVYFAYRVKCTRDGLLTSSPSDVIIAWVFLSLEMSIIGKSPYVPMLVSTMLAQSLASTYFRYIGAVALNKKRRIRPLFRLVGDDVPTVDVLIPCCGESFDVILDTVRAACALNYPKERYRVILLDDGNSADLKNQIESLGEGQENLHYTARGVNVKTHSKAANLNHGLTFVGKPEAAPSEYVAVLDVDMIPMPNLLRALLPHLIDRPSFAMATTPQYFYNIPDGDPLCQCADCLFNFVMLELDTSNSTPCTGTGLVLRRSAAEQIGGIPTDQTSEDLMTSLLLCAAGWNTAYVWEPLQWGLVPNSFTGHARQQRRWSSGFISIAIALLGSRLSKLSVTVRIYLAFIITAHMGAEVAMTCAMLFIPAVLISGKPFVVLETPQQLRNLLMLSALQLLVTWLNGLITAESIGFRMLIWPPCRHPFMAPFKSLGVLGTILPFKQIFTPTGNMLDSERERESRDSKSFIRRIKFLSGSLTLWVEILVVALTVFGATLSVETALGMDISYQDRLQRLFVRAAWPPAFVHWTMFIVECGKPILYVIFPPELPSREALLNRDPDTKVAYPSDRAKDGERIASSQWFSLVILAYGFFLLAFSWGTQFE